jgi:hypothetical protein
VDEKGNVSTKASIPVDTSGSVYGPNIRVVQDAGRIFVSVNHGVLLQVNAYEKNQLGLPSSCFQGGLAEVLSIHGSGLISKRESKLENFHIYSVLFWENSLYVGGRLLNYCSDKGVAAVYQILGENKKKLVWVDDTPFDSYVRGMIVANRKLVVAVNEDRAVAVSKADANLTRILGEKHFLETAGITREASIVWLDGNGKVLSREQVSAGSSVSLLGVAWTQGAPFIFGSLGGEPAMNLRLNQ